jgi:hypothetical protein
MMPFASELETVPGMGLRVINASPATPLRTAFWIEMLDGGEHLYVSSVRINGAEQLATQALVPAAVFELPESFAHVILPVMRPGDVLSVGFANRGDTPARFWFWLGESRALGELFGDPALRVRCPQCAAAVGERCSTANDCHLPRSTAYQARRGTSRALSGEKGQAEGSARLTRKGNGGP